MHFKYTYTPMRLTAFTDYSLRLLMYVAAAPEGRATIAEVALAHGISEHHLVKVAHFLGREGILHNSRGRNGGLRFEHPPREINVGRVVRLTEGRDRPAECFDRERNTCRITRNCKLKHLLHDATGAFFKTLEGHTLASIA